MIVSPIEKLKNGSFYVKSCIATLPVFANWRKNAKLA